MTKDFVRVQVESREEWRAWLEANHESTESIWLVTFKKTSGRPHVPYDAVVEEALCFGWIDSLPRKLDDERSMLRISPRKPGSAWSKANKERVERMIAAGKMHPAGLRKAEESKADGSWTFLDDVEALVIPDDLAAALAERENAGGELRGLPTLVEAWNTRMDQAGQEGRNPQQARPGDRRIGHQKHQGEPLSSVKDVSLVIGAG